MMTAQAKLLATEYRALTPAVRDALIARPELYLRVEKAAQGFALADTALPWETPPRAYFPKLGIKSWRDSGRLNICQVGWPARPHLEAILAAPTPAQITICKAWEESGTPLVLYLFPHLDFSDITEARFLCARDHVTFSSACLRGASASLFPDARAEMHALVRRLGSEFKMNSVIFDIGLRPDGTLAVVDINPGLTPQDMHKL